MKSQERFGLVEDDYGHYWLIQNGKQALPCVVVNRTNLTVDGRKARPIEAISIKRWLPNEVFHVNMPAGSENPTAIKSEK